MPPGRKSAAKAARSCYNIGMSAKEKGKSLLVFPEDYTVVDIETTGLCAGKSEIIEISAVKFRGRREEGSFSTLVKPSRPVGYFITRLTGITDEMAAGGADIKDALRGFSDFLGDDIIVGYNVNFDINFLHADMMRHLGVPLTNDFVDVLRFARRLLPQLPDHKQTTVAGYYGISVTGAHRAHADCLICNACLECLRQRQR